MAVQSYLSSSIEQTIKTDPRISTVEQIAFRGDGDVLQLEVVYTDINGESGTYNEKWTADKEAVFNPGYLAEVFYQFLVSHNEDGTHKNNAIKLKNIDFGTEKGQVNGTNIPAGEEVPVRGEVFSPNKNLIGIIKSLANRTDELYQYSNDILSRFEFLKAEPAAASVKNVDVKAGGERTIDGVHVTAGQLVFLKDQKNTVENGFWEVQTGAWNRYKGFESGNAFADKLIFIKTGTENKGKIFYTNDAFKQIGTDGLIFKECKATSYAKPFTAIVRDKDGRAKVAEPKETDDIARQKEVSEALSSAKSYAEQKAGNAESNAKRYADGEIQKIKSVSGSIGGNLAQEIKDRKAGDAKLGKKIDEILDINDSGNVLLAAAQNYTDQSVSAARGFTVQQVGSEKTERERGDASTLSSAKSYAESYTDGMLIKIFQNGYIQWEGMDEPSKIYPLAGTSLFWKHMCSIDITSLDIIPACSEGGT